jgi:hypothetical protein
MMLGREIDPWDRSSSLSVFEELAYTENEKENDDFPKNDVKLE